jgi:hypothetical protein
MKKTAYLACTLLIVVLLASCSGTAPADPTATPVDVNALQTAAVRTVVANITQTAVAQITATEAIPPTEPPTAIPAPTEIATPTVTPTSASCNNSAFVSDASVTDGTQMTSGQEFIKTWKVKNTGACTWTTGYRIIFSYGEAMGGMLTELTTDVVPDTETEISVKMRAPVKSGTYSGYWRLATNNAVPFGEIFTVIITVP